MQNYLNFLNNILCNGEKRPDRTNTGVISLFGAQMRFDLEEGFPLVSTKKIHLKSVIYELLWFLQGNTNIKYLNDHGVRIWDEWADENGELGPIYGKQWRAWESKEGRIIDQIKNLIQEIKINPYSRRLLVNAWNVGDLPQMALAPCHVLFQFYVAENKLSCQIYQRSADAFLGVPFNIASYAILTHLIAKQCDLDLGELIWTGGDCHIYSNHIEQVKLQCSRKPFPLPKLQIPKKNLNDYIYEDFCVSNYQYHPLIKAPIAV